MPRSNIYNKGKHHLTRLFPFIILILTFSSTFKTEESDKSSSNNSTNPSSQKPNHQQTADSLLQSSNSFIRSGKFPEALDLAEQSLSISKEVKDKKSIGNSLNKIATINYYQGNFFEALLYYDRSISSYEECDYKNGIASSVNNKGAIYYYLGNYPKALEHYKKAAELNEELNNKKQSAATIQNIGGIYIELNDYKNAMRHFEIAKETYLELGDKKVLSQVLNGIGEILLRQDDLENAAKQFESALNLAKEINDKQKLVEVMLNLGEINQKMKLYPKALNFYEETLRLSKEINNNMYTSLALISLGSSHKELNQYSKAINNCKNGLQIAEQMHALSVQKEGCDCLYDTYKSIRQNRKALEYLEQSIILQDSLSAKEAADEILSMQFEKEMLMDSIAHAKNRQELKLQHEEDIRKKEKQRNILIIAGAFLLILALGILSRLNYVRKSKKILQVEKDRSEHLLLNILPEEIASELKEKGYVDAQDFERATILFTDFKSFTETASRLTPQELVEEINVCFKAFDKIIERNKVEKIKTIGDAYMAAGGVPKPDANSVKNTILAALQMQEFMTNRKSKNQDLDKPAFEMRVGIHVGPIVAGIVGVKKFQYDIWGDTVNTASRMESNSEVGKVNISRDTYDLVKHEECFSFQYRGKLKAKGKGELEMYFVSKIEKPVPGPTKINSQASLVSIG